MLRSNKYPGLGPKTLNILGRNDAPKMKVDQVGVDRNVSPFPSWWAVNPKPGKASNLGPIWAMMFLLKQTHTSSILRKKKGFNVLSLFLRLIELWDAIWQGDPKNRCVQRVPCLESHVICIGSIEESTSFNKQP